MLEWPVRVSHVVVSQIFRFFAWIISPFDGWFGVNLSCYVPFSDLTLLVGRQEGHLACKKTGCWFVGDDLTGALHDL